MARIPIYEERQTVSGGRGIPEMRVPDANLGAMGKALGNVGQAMQQTAQVMHDVEEENAKAEANNVFATSEIEWKQKLNDMQNSAEPGAKNFTKNVASEFDTWSDQTLKATANPRTRRMLAANMSSMRKSILGSSLSFEATEGVNYRFNLHKDSILKYGQGVALDPTPETLNRTFTAGMDGINASNMPESKKQELRTLLKETIGGSYAEATIRRDPEKFLDDVGMKSGGPAFEPALNFVFQMEGGYVEKDGKTAAPANFGINQKANPDIDVKNLTKDGAAKIYRQRYWDAINAGDLPPQLAAVAFDTAVNMGVGTAKKLIAQSNGNVDTLLQLRRDEYNRLAQDPENAKYLKGWMNRVDKLQAFVKEMKPSEMQATASGNPGLDMVDARKWDTYIRAANTYASQQRSVYRAELERQVGDANAMAVNGITNPTQLAQDQFIRAYGPQDGTRKFQEYQDNQVLAGDISTMKTMPNEAINAFVASKQPVPGEGYEMASKRHQIMSAAAGRVLKMREDDPAVFALSSSKTVETSYKAFIDVTGKAGATLDEQKTAARNYASASIAEQTRLGIGSPKILSKSAIDNIQQQFIGAQDGESIAVKIDAMSKIWGDSWPVVYRQLIQSKALPPSAIVIGSGMTGAAAADMAIASKLKVDDILVGLPSDTKKIIGEKVAAELEDFKFSMVGSDGSPRTIGGIEQFNIFYDETVRLASYYRAQGMNESDAAKKAAQSTVMGRYVFSNTYRVPMSVGAAGVQEGANYFLQNINPDDLAIPETMRRDSFVSKDYAKSIRKNSYWVTSPSEDGLVLFNADSRSPVLNKAGKPIVYTWGQLKSAGENQRSAIETMFSVPMMP
jgi:lysozyme family protein